MEIASLQKQGLKIKGKNASLVVEPGEKTNADAVLLLSRTSGSLPEVEESRISIDSPGEYEVGGIKISAKSSGEDVFYNLRIDGIDLLLSKASTFQRAKDEVKECQIALLDIDSEFPQSQISDLSPKVLVLYGAKKDEAAKALGDSERSKKYQVTLDKLPEITRTVVLD